MSRMSKKQKDEARKGQKAGKKGGKSESLLKKKRKGYGASAASATFSAATARGMVDCPSCKANYSLNALYENEGRCTRFVTSEETVVRCNAKLQRQGIRC